MCAHAVHYQYLPLYRLVMTHNPHVNMTSNGLVYPRDIQNMTIDETLEFSVVSDDGQIIQDVTLRIRIIRNP